MAIVLPQELIREVYQQGARVRLSNMPKVCPFPSNDLKSYQLKYWWYAGWNDTDMELR